MFSLSYRAKLALILMSFAGSILLLAFFSVSVLLQSKQVDKAIIDAENIYHEKIKLFYSYIDDIDNTLIAIENSQVFQEYLKNPSDENLKKVNEMFVTLSNSNRHIMQLRYIDNNGLEKVRVDRNNPGLNPILITSDKLQDKKQRYYFNEILNMSKNTVWYSKIDLNIEHKMIEIPIKPVLRIGIPVKRKNGILIVNIFIEEFLYSLISSSVYDIYLVDKDGYILVSSNNQYNWSRYLGEQIRFENLNLGDEFYEQSIDFDNSENLKLYFLPKKSTVYKLLYDEKKSILITMFVMLLLGIPLSYFFSLYPAKLEKELVRFNGHLQEKIEYTQKQEELLTSIINAADDMIFYKDMNSIYLGFNNAYERWMNLPKEKIIGKKDFDLYSKSVAQDHIRSDKYVLDHNLTIVIEEKFEKKNSSSSILQVKKSPFYDTNGDIIGLVVVARDVSKQKNMEKELQELNTVLESKVEEKTQQLQKSNDLLAEHIRNLEELNTKLTKAKEEAQQAAQARSNFISSISHELRTPLNAIINFTDQIIEDFDEMLADKELQSDTQVYLKRVIANSRHLLQLINDLLEFTKAEVGKMDYKIEEHEINKILKIAYNNTFSLLNGTDVAFYLNLYEKQLVGIVDERRFLQIILNLLSNAIKFTKKGFIEMRSFVEENFIIIEIEDTGKGIPKENHKMIFEPFMQVKSTDNGTGLGLGLAKKMCDDMNINISFISVEGGGTIFRLMFKNIRG